MKNTNKLSIKTALWHCVINNPSFVTIANINSRFLLPYPTTIKD